MIEYIKDDIFNTNCDCIAHQTNCKSKMGSGIAYSVRIRYPNVFASYKKYCDLLGNKLLGKIQPIECDDVIIVNLFAQDDYGRDKKQYTDYDALDMCLKKLYDYCEVHNYSLAIPYKIGCNRGGGSWVVVRGMIEKYFKDSYIKCVIYIKEY